MATFFLNEENCREGVAVLVTVKSTSKLAKKNLSEMIAAGMRLVYNTFYGWLSATPFTDLFLTCWLHRFGGVREG